MISVKRRNGQSAGQSRDAPLDAESHGQHSGGCARAPAPEGCGVLADTAEMWDCILCSFPQEESWRTRRDQGGMDWILSAEETVTRAWVSKLRSTAEMLASGPVILILTDQVTTQVVTSPLDLGNGKPKIRTLRLTLSETKGLFLADASWQV